MAAVGFWFAFARTFSRAALYIRSGLRDPLFCRAYAEYGCWAFCPDPVDFRYFQLINIYEDENAYYRKSEWLNAPVRPWMRGVDDQVMVTVKEASRLELVLGNRGRSGEQMDIFQAVFGPAGADGYPQLLYDKGTGAIDREVAAYWREHYDLRHIMERDWPRLGTKLEGKLHIFIGDTDTFYLEEAVLLLEKFLRGATNPPFGGQVEYGKRAPHRWSGVPPGANPSSYYIPIMAEHITRTAPAGVSPHHGRFPSPEVPFITTSMLMTGERVILFGAKLVF